MSNNRFEMIGQRPQIRTHYLFVIDKSSSMRSLAGSTISGFNETLGDIQAEDPEAPVTLVLFSDEAEMVFASRPARQVPPLSESNYRPGGWTALYDAMGKAIQEAEPAVIEGERALVCIITDGQENSSRRFDKQQAMALVQRLEGQGNWTFTYLSAAPEAFADARGFGLRAGNTQSFDASPVGTRAAWEGLRTARLAYSTGMAPQSASFYSGPTNTGGEDPEEGQPDPGSSNG